MAQKVGYWDNNVKYTEGPFVGVNAGGWRIEVATGLANEISTPALPHFSIYRLLEIEKGKKPGKLQTFEEISIFVDWLNQEVTNGRIVFNKYWTCPEYNS